MALGRARWVWIWWWDGEGGTPQSLPGHLRWLPGLQPSTGAGPTRPQLRLLEVSQPLWGGDGTPYGLCIQTESLLRAASACCFLLCTDESLPPCCTSPPQGPRYLPLLPADPSQAATPKQLCRPLAGLAVFGRALALYFPPLLHSGTQNRGYSQARLWQGWGWCWRRDALFISPNNAPFFNLLMFLPQYNTPASHSACDPLHPPGLLCRAATLPASLPIYLDFFPPTPYLLG